MTLMLTILVFPERLLIYNAGTIKTAYISITKIACFAVFAGSCILLAPIYYYDPASPAWVPAAVICIGAAPMLVTAYATAPFVNSAFLFIPQYARKSGDILMRYAKNLPPDARLELVTIRFAGYPQKTTGTMLSELRPYKRRFGIANVERVPWEKDGQAAAGWRRWTRWLDEPRNKFYVTNDKDVMKRSKVPGIWNHVMDAIKRNG
ncbi:hypothetical protein H2201_007778 [Coniosporium apollinis]|uniref:Uncharacterized protein n=2 Tax=Coniosporium TaxID=2810619 RepID=A0ABQ9NLJ3_9PEZI|nr:hypothetical protein H2199_003930 [Cladosporium sp. JES 115]KAJ9658459.1 hypothetical protein H2201_007778 [Coniosporium apollinis]